MRSVILLSVTELIPLYKALFSYPIVKRAFPTAESATEGLEIAMPSWPMIEYRAET
jgi:hypothetical protein